jgi:hypothetical protein
MDYGNIWNKITSALKKSREFPTTPTTNKTPLWFCAHSRNGRDIEVTSAVHNKPSSKISGTRILTEDGFKKVYPLYLRRKNGESVTEEAQAATFHIVYFYSLIKHLGDDDM